MRLLLSRRLSRLEDTQALAEEVLGLLPRGALVAIEGPLGAGKTTFVGFLVRALGFPGRVTSPTYTLIHTYPTPEGPAVHADLYRLQDPSLLPAQLAAAPEAARPGLVDRGPPHPPAASHLLRLSPEGEARRAELWEVGPGEEKGV